MIYLAATHDLVQVTSPVGPQCDILLELPEQDAPAANHFYRNNKNKKI